MVAKVFGGLGALILVFLVFVAAQPNDFRYERSTVISAPAPIIYGHINDLKRWDEWSPWAKLDPNSKSSFDGPSSGVGSKMSWSGNNQVGQGSMTITESAPAKHITLQLEFIKPMAAGHTAEFIFEPVNKKETKVTWAMYGTNNYMGKLMGVVMNCEKMMNGYFDQGLASLKSITEAQAKAE